MLKMAVLVAAQLATTTSSEDESRFQAALHTQEEARSYAARSLTGYRVRCREAAPNLQFIESQRQTLAGQPPPKSLTSHGPTPR